jgi:hypothetical protein
MIAVPVEFEIHEDKELLAKVRMFDEGGASVEIKTVVGEHTWAALSECIQQSLDLMFQPEEIK